MANKQTTESGTNTQQVRQQNAQSAKNNSELNLLAKQTYKK